VGGAGLYDRRNQSYLSAALQASEEGRTSTKPNFSSYFEKRNRNAEGIRRPVQKAFITVLGSNGQRGNRGKGPAELLP